LSAAGSTLNLRLISAQIPSKDGFVGIISLFYGDSVLNSELSFEQQAYEIPELWEDAFFVGENSKRFSALVALVGPEVSSLLDVGCGNGRFIRELLNNGRPNLLRAVGVDRSKEALSHCQFEKFECTVDRLPFRDGEFHTVFCNEVLEHLSVKVYPQAVAELCRVSSHSVILCVPYKQNLKLCLSQCPHCHARFNADFHVRSFDESTLEAAMLPHGFNVTNTSYIGSEATRIDQLIRARLRARFAKTLPWQPYGVCPVCGFTNKALLKEMLDRAITLGRRDASRRDSALRRIIKAVLPSNSAPLWIAVAFARR